MNTAIIVAAGKGTRFREAKKRKQFLEVLGKPLVVHTLQRFEDCSAVNEMILVLPEKEIENFLQIAEKFGLKKLTKIVSGGETRPASVLKGLNAVESNKTEIVAIHDGARPLVSNDEIIKTINKAKQTGAACLVASVTDTIKEVSGETIVRTVDRAKLRRALTPQAFRYEILKRAFTENDFDEKATDECFLVEKLGVEISVVEGSARNIKITNKEDLILAENLLKDFR
ncbi:MAG: 2-C-methyl-D-erythritol 4-phosphate cytidylyltransferase [Acidobacteria bacterium]|nr:2-C-methyl-D-erythritol 4-phosphate cytidylyltransferase [Acidobacteriota bacterium]MCA1640110.1 2-C-methyl-D-erythritol 4-phosphate cytidylyltransferase [Acidobacteriota bacterium]